MTRTQIEDFQVKGKTVERILSCGHKQVVELPTYQAVNAYARMLRREMVDCSICTEIEVAQKVIRTAEQEKADLFHVAAYLNREQCELTGQEILLVQVLLDREIASLEQKITSVVAGIQQLGQQAYSLPPIHERARA